MRMFFLQHYLLQHYQRTSAFIVRLLPVCLLLAGTYSFIPYIKAAHAQTTGFVTRSGTHLLLDGNQFRFAGANIYWLGLDDGAQTYPTPFRIEDALTTANEMGLTVVRAHSLGVSVGCSLCVEPSLGVFNSTAFQHIDYAIQAAKAHGLHLIIPLTDNYYFYHGGKHTFTDWRGITDENQFYTNTQVISDFEKYIYTIFTHVNSYTGVSYLHDSTIIAWETGNEILPPSSWTHVISGYMKGIDPNHLVLDGNYGVDPNSLSIPTVDIYSDHSYPPDMARVASDTAATSGASKAYVIGEYDWETTHGVPLSAFLAAALNNPNVAGDIFWSIWPHDDTHGYFVGFGGINLTYPGDTPDRRQRIQTIRAHGYAMQRRSIPVESLPGAPLISSVNGHQVVWRGATLGDTYAIERSTISGVGPWTLVCNRCVTDYNPPFLDTTQPAMPTWYRIRAYNRVGLPGNYSPVYGLHTAVRLLDNLNDWNQTFYHTSTLGFDTSNPQYFNGDLSRAYRAVTLPGGVNEIIWHVQNMYSFSATTYFWPRELVSPFLIYVSYDANHWTQIRPNITGGSGDWRQYTYSVSNLSNINFVRIRWGNPVGQSWSPQLGQVVIS
ncbi:MAG: hypothetical protein NVS2B12_16950 [Ktedonobacteraceae bacterium]